MCQSIQSLTIPKLLLNTEASYPAVMPVPPRAAPPPEAADAPSPVRPVPPSVAPPPEAADAAIVKPVPPRATPPPEAAEAAEPVSEIAKKKMPVGAVAAMPGFMPNNNNRGSPRKDPPPLKQEPEPEPEPVPEPEVKPQQLSDTEPEPVKGVLELPAASTTRSTPALSTTALSVGSRHSSRHSSRRNSFEQLAAANGALDPNR